MMVVKAIVVRKSLGPKRPCRFDPGRGYKEREYIVFSFLFYLIYSYIINMKLSITQYEFTNDTVV